LQALLHLHVGAVKGGLFLWSPFALRCSGKMGL
jgi:hypothetical protein